MVAHSQDQTQFAGAVRAAVREAGAGKLVTFGVPPPYAETGYGDIKAGSPTGHSDEAGVVDAFADSTRCGTGGGPDRRSSIPVTAARIRIADPYRRYRRQIAELPDRMGDQGVTLHTGRNLIKALTIASPGHDPVDVAVKAFAVPARSRGFVYAHLRRSKALRSMLNAQKLAEMGVGTPDPVACIEFHESGCLRRSYYVCRYWLHDYDLTALLYRGATRGLDPKAVLDQLARFTHTQHDRGVLHCDYNPGNILVRSKGTNFDFALVDLNRLRFKQLGLNDRISGLVRITTIADYLRIIGRRYAMLYGVDPDDFCRQLEVEQHRFVIRRHRMKRMMASLR